MTMIAGKLKKHTGAPTQQEPAPGTAPNAGGGFSFPVDDWTRLQRFLVLGTEGGSYYAGERQLTRENSAALDRCLAADPARAVELIASISEAGRAPRNSYAIFALAQALQHPSAKARELASKAAPRVCRISTHLFELADALWHGAQGKKSKGAPAQAQARPPHDGQLGGVSLGATAGFGPAKLKAIRRWYEGKSAGDFAYEAMKYQQREGWSHARLLRLSHPHRVVAPAKIPASPDYAEASAWNEVARWALKGWPDIGEQPHPDPVLRRIWAHERAKRETRPAELVKLISDYRLPREALPTEALRHAEVWEALLDNGGKGMPVTAMVRNLGKMTAVGLIAPLSEAANKVARYLCDVERLRKGRVHPIAILKAARQYAEGHGDKGSLAWVPNPQVIEALDRAFYLAFGLVPSTGLRRLMAVDCSGSMQAEIAGLPRTSCREAGIILASVALQTEERCHVVGYSSRLVEAELRKSDNLAQAVQRFPMIAEATDCALPMLWAAQRKIPVDSFELYTDSETNGQSMHPFLALEYYRQTMGIGAKMVVCGMVAGGFTVADPKDAGSMDVVGFDTATPAVVADFLTGGKVQAESASSEE